MAKTTSTERSAKYVKRLNKLAKSHGYPTWRRLSSAILRGDVVMTITKPQNLSDNDT